MTHEPLPTKPPFPWWSKALAGLALLLVLLLVFVETLGRVGTTKWLRYAAKLREGGTPLTFAEIEAQRAVVPEEVNSARVIECLRPSLETNEYFGGGELQWVLVLGSSSPDVDFSVGIPRYTIEPSQRYLDKHRMVLEELATLKNMLRGRFDIVFQKNPLQTSLPDYSALRRASKLLQLHALMSLLQDDTSSAAEDVVLQLRLAETLHDDPFLISRLVQISVEHMAVKGLENLLRVAEPDSATLLELQRELDRQIAASTIRWAFLGERAMLVEFFDGLASGKLPRSLDVITKPKFPSPAMFSPDQIPLPVVLLRANQMCTARMLTWLIDAGDDPQAQLAAAKRIDVETPQLPWAQIITKMILPSVSRAVQLHQRIGVHLQAARVALAAERFRLVWGKFPEEIADLVPEYLDAVPTDPFDDGRPMRMTVKEEGLVIYSVGDNGTDDGGEVTPPPNVRQPRDVGFRLNHPEQRGLKILDSPPPADK